MTLLDALIRFILLNQEYFPFLEGCLITEHHPEYGILIVFVVPRLLLIHYDQGFDYGFTCLPFAGELKISCLYNIENGRAKIFETTIEHPDGHTARSIGNIFFAGIERINFQRARVCGIKGEICRLFRPINKFLRGEKAND